MATRGPGLAATTLRTETIVDINRGRLRGWAVIAAAIFVVLAALSWPALVYFVVFLAAAAASLVASVWVHLTYPNVERQRPNEPESVSRDSD